MAHFQRSWPWWRWLLTGLSALAFSLSVYLSWHYLTGASVIGCSGGSSCDQVLSSRWSSVGGVLPVSGLATGTYLAILLASFFIGPATAAPDRRLAWEAMLILVGAAAGSAVWFTIVQKWIVGAFCPYCLATHAIGVLLAAVVVWRALAERDDRTEGVQATGVSPPTVTRAARHLLIGRAPTIGLTLIGLSLGAILALCQFKLTSSAVYQAGETQVSLPTIDPHNAPLVGSPDAPYVVTLLFDYNCPHCQKMYSMLDEVIARYDGKVAFVLCPAPLNSQCNPYVGQSAQQFKNSCELARIALTVWSAKREAFADFDRWMFSPEAGERWRPRTLDAARAKAIELVGQARFDAAGTDPWIDRYLQTSIQTFGDTIQNGNAVPKLVFGPRWVTPQPRDADELASVLHESLGVPAP